MAVRKSKPPVKDGITYKDGAGTETHDGIDYPEQHKSFDELATGGRAKMKHEEKKERKDGGSAKSGRSNDEGDEGTGSPEFFGGAESPTAKAAKGNRTMKTGGRMKRKRGGAAVEGKMARHRMDRPRRATGGRMVGADVRPLTEANKLSPPKGDKSNAAQNSEDD